MIGDNNMSYYGCDECKCRNCANTACAGRNCKICREICDANGLANCNITIVCRQYEAISTNANIARYNGNYKAIKGGRENYGR